MLDLIKLITLKNEESQKVLDGLKPPETKVPDNYAATYMADIANSLSALEWQWQEIPALSPAPTTGAPGGADEVLKDEDFIYENYCRQNFIKDVYHPAIKELEDNCYCTPGFDPYDENDDDNRLLLFKNNKETGEEYITDLVSGDDIKGFIIATGDDDWKKICIDFIYVMPQYRGLGVGKRFIKSLITGLDAHHGSNMTSLTAEIFVGNNASQSMFESLGFKPYCLCFKYEGDGTDKG